SSDEDDAPRAATTRKGKKPARAASSDDEDEPQPARTPKVKKPARAVSSDEDDAPRAATTRKGKKPARAASSDEENEPQPARTPKVKKPARAVSSDEDDAPRAATTRKGKKPARITSSDEDDEPRPARNLKGKKSARPPSSDGDDKPQPAATRKGKKPARITSSDEDDEPRPARNLKGKKRLRSPDSSSDNDQQAQRPRKQHKKRSSLPNTHPSLRKPGSRFEWRNKENHKPAEWLAQFVDELDAFDEAKARYTRETQIATECIDKFQFPGETDGDMETRIHTFFKNRLQQRHKAIRELKDQNAQENDKDRLMKREESIKAELAPLLKNLKARAPSASELWAAAHKDLVETHRDELGGDIGARQQAKAELFRALSPEVQAMWAAKAQEAKDQWLNDPDAYLKNQDGFPDLLAKHLRGFVGFGPSQIGSAVMHLRLAYRNAAGTIESDQFTIRCDDSVLPFSDFQGGPPEAELNRWDQYLEVALPANPKRRDSRLEFDDSGHAILPEFDPTWNMVQAAEILDAWLAALWAEANRDGDGSSLHWAALQDDIKEYIPATWHTARIAQPSTLPVHLLPARTNKIIYTSPSKRTSTTSRLTSPAQGSSLLWPPTPPARESPTNEPTNAPRTPREPTPRPVRPHSTAVAPHDGNTPLATIPEVTAADVGLPGWAVLPDERSSSASVIELIGDSEHAARSGTERATPGVSGDHARPARLSDDEQPAPASVSNNAEDSDSPVPPPPSRKRLSKARPARLSDDEQPAPASVSNNAEDSDSPVPPPPSRKRLSKARPARLSDDEQPAPASVSNNAEDTAISLSDDAEDAPRPSTSRKRRSKARPARVSHDKQPSLISLSDHEEDVGSPASPVPSTSRKHSQQQGRTTRQLESAREEGPSAKRRRKQAVPEGPPRETRGARAAREAASKPVTRKRADTKA
ncbi:hypothetical protein C2E23DRAFT_698892, partial [Lenzites betulinus]